MTQTTKRNLIGLCVLGQVALLPVPGSSTARLILSGGGAAMVIWWDLFDRSRTWRQRAKWWGPLVVGGALMLWASYDPERFSRPVTLSLAFTGVAILVIPLLYQFFELTRLVWRANISVRRFRRDLEAWRKGGGVGPPPSFNPDI